MTIEDAKAQVEAIWSKLDPHTHEFADWLADMLSNPAFPMLLRIAAMARICGSTAYGLVDAIDGADGGDPIALESLHRNDLLPHIPGMLRAAADLYEAAEKQRDPQPEPPPVKLDG